MNDKPRCCELVMGTGSYASFKKTPCTRPVRVTVDGKHYCAIHDPVKVAQRAAKSRERWSAKWDENEAAEKVRKETERKAACFDTLVEALATMLGCAETDCLDDKSNVWRSAMIDAGDALKEAKP